MKPKIAVLNEIKLEKGIPCVGRPGPGIQAKYPFRSMEVDDSFAVPTSQVSTMTLSRTAQVWKTKLGFNFACRKLIEDGVEVTRVWRIK